MMTDREKALSGQWYNPAADPELRQQMKRTQALLYDYNRLHPSDSEGRDALIRQILGQVGEECCILQPFLCDYGVNISVGHHFFMNKGCQILDGGRVTFGDNVFVGPMCGFHTAIHPFGVEQRNRGEERAEPIRVGNNVWIGAQVCVLPGVTIGDNSVIGAGSVVSRDIPAGVVAAGNPCRVLRKL